ARRAARYTGNISGGKMTLTVTLDGTEQTLGPFSLVHGALPQLRKCR
ncbi:MAG: hypothetical protein H7Z38_00150, partial [Rubrivivax sp.]|nr:hypothetical protein [Pyrinomonadaceae bacterium]